MSDMAEAIEEVGSGYNHQYELLEQDKVVWAGDGHFIDQSWVSLGEARPVQPVWTDRPFVLSTFLRHDEGALKGESYAHDRHPFVVFLHLLDKAEANSTVFMSIPFLSDFDAIDQLCHYADPRYGSLTINIILGPARTNIENLENFVGGRQDREESVGRLHMKIFGRDDSAKTTSYSHSKAMVSTAGGMIGSYNYTVASRKRHLESGTFIPPDFEDLPGLQSELGHLWNTLVGQQEIQIRRKQAPKRNIPEAGKVFNPYAKK